MVRIVLGQTFPGCSHKCPRLPPWRFFRKSWKLPPIFMVPLDSPFDADSIRTMVVVSEMGLGERSPERSEGAERLGSERSERSVS
jgi:hypothetical protein